MERHYCVHCKEHWDGDNHCPRCGTAEVNYAPLVITAMIAVLFFIVILSFFGIKLILLNLMPEEHSYEAVYQIETEDVHNNLEAQTRPAPTEQPVPNGCLGDGLYEVGKDIPAGEYVVMSDRTLPSMDIAPTFHLSVFNDDALQDDNRAVGGWVNYSAIIRVEEGQFVELLHAVMYHADQPSRLDPFTDGGMFCAGRDMPAGTYTVISTHDQYSGYCVIGTDPNVVQEQHNPVYNIPFGETEQITLQEGEYIKMEFCHLVNTSESGGSFISYGEEPSE